MPDVPPDLDLTANLRQSLTVADQVSLPSSAADGRLRGGHLGVNVRGSADRAVSQMLVLAGGGRATHCSSPGFSYAGPEAAFAHLGEHRNWQDRAEGLCLISPRDTDDAGVAVAGRAIPSRIETPPEPNVGPIECSRPRNDGT